MLAEEGLLFAPGVGFSPSAMVDYATRVTESRCCVVQFVGCWLLH